MTTIDEQFKKDFGKRLKQLRKQNSLTINQLIEKLLNFYIDIDEKSIRRYEKGERLPKVDNLIALSEIFDTSLDYLIFGKESSDDNSFTWYDNFKRLNRLVYSLAINLLEDKERGKYYLELWEDEAKVYWERLQLFGVNNNYNFEARHKNPSFSVNDLDNLFNDFLEDKEQLVPTKKRLDAFLESQGINPEEYLKAKLNKLQKKK